MAVNMLIGYKNADGTVDSIISRVDGGVDQEKLFYKYYRTPERVKALIMNGSGLSSLGIYISDDELNPSSPLFNKEVLTLPLNIGFPEDDFYQKCSFYYSPENRKYIKHAPDKYSNEKLFYKDADDNNFWGEYVFLYDSATKQWTEGYDKYDLRNAIIDTFDEECDDEGYDDYDREELIRALDEIDKFIAKRDSRENDICFANSNDSVLLNYPKLYAKYNELVRLAEKEGIKIVANFYKPVEVQEQDVKKRELR